MVMENLRRFLPNPEELITAAPRIILCSRCSLPIECRNRETKRARRPNNELGASVKDTCGLERVREEHERAKMTP